MTPPITSFQGEHRFLSNFWPSPMNFGGLSAATAEHAYQACKFDDPKVYNPILNARTPGIAKRLSRQHPVRSDWDEIKVSVMHDILIMKFAQNPDLAAMLLATGDAELIEGNTWGDRFWGVCRGEGENHLGKLLMRVRTGLREWEAAGRKL